MFQSNFFNNKGYIFLSDFFLSYFLIHSEYEEEAYDKLGFLNPNLS